MHLHIAPKLERAFRKLDIRVAEKQVENAIDAELDAAYEVVRMVDWFLHQVEERDDAAFDALDAAFHGFQDRHANVHAAMEQLDTVRT